MAESPLDFQKGTLIDPEGVSYPLNDVLSMKAVMHLEYPSSLTFSLKKKQENTQRGLSARLLLRACSLRACSCRTSTESTG